MSELPLVRHIRTLVGSETSSGFFRRALSVRYTRAVHGGFWGAKVETAAGNQGSIHPVRLALCQEIRLGGSDGKWWQDMGNGVPDSCSRIPEHFFFDLFGHRPRSPRAHVRGIGVTWGFLSFFGGVPIGYVS